MIGTLVILFAAQATATPTPRPMATPAPISILQHSGSREDVPRGQSLADVAKGIKLKMTPGARLLDNEAVKALAQGVELTTAKPAPGSGGASAGRQGAGRGAEDGKRQFWQEKFQRARTRVAFLESEIQRLDTLAKDLAQKFYSWDDPAYRDGVIKPAWDKALVDLRTAQTQLDEARGGPDQVIDDAQADGALPGWFRGLPEPTAEEMARPTPRPAAPTFAPSID